MNGTMSTYNSYSLQNPSELEDDQDEEDIGETENGEEGEKKTGGNAGRCVTLQSLLGAGVLEPGEGAMTIDYLGKKFTGDLLLDGKIKSQETEKIYPSPTAWAVSCKKIVNPAKQSGCGWSTVRYKGRKLDAYKSIWLKKQYDESCLAYDFMEAFSKNMMERDLGEEDGASSGTPPPLTLEDPHHPDLVGKKQRSVVKHSILGNRQPSHDENILVESVTFTSLGKIQPFLVSLTSNAALVIDFHCHLTSSEVTGYLAGIWDVNSHVMTISHAYPLRARLGDFKQGPLIEAEALQSIRSSGLTLLGWYHSHPRDPASPSLRDIDTQLEYQLRMKGTSDSAYIPCIGLICSPYNAFNAALESQLIFYWVAPPPESRIHEYGKPMTMNHTIHQNDSIPHYVLMEMKKCADFYKKDSDYIVFENVYKKGITYLDTLKISISTKFPRNHESGETEIKLWNCLRDVATSTSEKPELEVIEAMVTIAKTPSVSPPPDELCIPNLLPVMKGLDLKSMRSTSPIPAPSVPKPQARRRRSSSREAKPSLPSLSNYYVGSDLASALFGPSNAAALMGFDPTALSLLNLNSLGLGSMFLPPMPPYKPDPGIGLMKPPPPPSPFYPFSASRSSRSRSSSSSPSSSHRNSPSSSSSRDMPPPNKVPKLENNLIPPLGKNCSITISSSLESSNSNSSK